MNVKMAVCFVRNNVSGLVVAFVAKYERYIVAHDAKEFQKTFRLGHGKVARQYRRNGQGKICEFNDVEPRKFHKAVYAVSAHKVLFTTQVQVSCVGFMKIVKTNKVVAWFFYVILRSEAT